MRKFLVAIACSICAINVFSQTNYAWGGKFDFDLQNEKDPRFVLADNYNIYLLTNTNVDGMLSSHKATLRKFDQKNQLVNTITQEFVKLDIGTLYNYLGCKELSNNQVAVFAESYSGKLKKKDIYKYVFDKGTGKFSSSLVVSWPIESAMKSGTTKLALSENGRYIGLLNMKDGSKKDPVSDNVVMLDGSTGAIVWQKEAVLDGSLYERAFTVTNSGKAVLLRAAKGLKLSNALTIVTEAGTEDKTFEDAIMLQHPVAISIGQADYLIDFNYAAKGLRGGDFENLLLYDLGAGKTLKNNKTSDFNNIKDLSDVEIRNSFIQNNEIHLFVEAKFKSGTRQVKLNPMSSFTTEEPIYKFGPSFLIVLGLDGQLKFMRGLTIADNSFAELYHSFGLLNVNGKYFVNREGPGGVYELPADEKTRARPFYAINYSTSDPIPGGQYLPQLFVYTRDAKKYTVARTYYDNKMSLVSVIGFPEP